MGRPKLSALGGWVYHVLNRANERMPIFTKDEGFIPFQIVLQEAVARTGDSAAFVLSDGKSLAPGGVASGR